MMANAWSEATQAIIVTPPPVLYRIYLICYWSACWASRMVFESGLMYDSNAEEDHLPMILIADVEIPRSAAVVAAPILNEWPV